MTRLVRMALAAASAIVLLLPLALASAPVAFAADPPRGEERVLISVRGDVTVPAGDHQDTVLVVEGVATVQGRVGTLVVIEGSATLAAGQAETVWAIRSDIELGAGSVVTGDVHTIDATVHRTGDAAVLGEVSDISTSLVAIGAVLAPAIALFWLGIGLATIAAGLLLAGVAGRQVRAAERIITDEPLKAVGVGLLAMIAIPIAAVILFVTVVGAPLGLGLLLGLWPLLAFVGYLVAGIWVGEWVQRRLAPARDRERPYAAAVIGLLILLAIGLVPVLSIVSAIASLFGFGAVVLLAWRSLTASTEGPAAAAAIPAPTPA